MTIVLKGTFMVDDSVTLAREEHEKLLTQIEHERWLRDRAEDRCVAVEDQREELRGEVDRLRAALEEIAATYTVGGIGKRTKHPVKSRGEMFQIAQKALRLSYKLNAPK